MDISQAKKLADNVVSLDHSINIEFHKLTFLYWVLKNSNNNNIKNIELNKKSLFLKSYLHRNIISYRPYNLSQNIISLSNKKNTEQDENSQQLSKYALGIIDTIEHIGLPFLKQRFNYCLNELKELDNQVKQISDFLNKSTGSHEIKIFREKVKLFNNNMIKQVSIRGDDGKEKTIFDNIAETNFTPLNIKSLSNLTNLRTKKETTKKPVIKVFDMRIKCFAARQDIINVFNEMKWTYIKFDNIKDLASILKNHFIFDNVTANHSAVAYDENTKIKWRVKNQRLLIHFVQQLIEESFIDAPAHSYDKLIENHFYDDINDKRYIAKKIRDNGNAMLKTNGVPKGHKEIDIILKKYLPSHQ